MLHHNGLGRTAGEYSRVLPHTYRRRRADLYLRDAIEQTDFSCNANLTSGRVHQFGGLRESATVSSPHDDGQPRWIRKRTSNVQERGLPCGVFHIGSRCDFPAKCASLSNQGSGLVPSDAGWAEGICSIDTSQAEEAPSDTQCCHQHCRGQCGSLDPPILSRCRSGLHLAF